MKRIKSIDIFRGLSMIWMFLGHLLAWWLIREDIWLSEVCFAILDPLGASAFLFIAGVSTTISYRNRCIKAEFKDDYNMKMARNEYLFRTLFILIIALIFNLFTAIILNNPLRIWSWNILQTIAFSLFMAWPLLKTSKIFRIFLGAITWIANQLILACLYPYRGQPNFYGVLYHLVYTNLELDPIFSFFTFFLIGTVMGDIIFDIYFLENQNERKIALKNRLFLPSLIFGTILIIFGILFEINMEYNFGYRTLELPDFLNRGSFSWMIYSLGIELILLSTLAFLEEFEIIKTKKSYKFIFYFSYYSLTIYLAHNLLYFLFLVQLNEINIWFFITCTIILVGLLLRMIYKRWEDNASIKVQIARISLKLARMVEEKKKNKKYSITL